MINRGLRARISRSVRTATLLVVAWSSLEGCRRAPEAPASTDAASPNLPPLVVTNATEGLVFSYMTLDGGFQLVKKVDDVPYESRDAVRVWVDATGVGIAGPHVYLADLRTQLPDGTYRVDVVPRSRLDEMAERRRHKRLAEAAASTKGPSAPAPGQGASAKRTQVIIYGADWCGPCHQAEAHLRDKGVAFVHKDIEDGNVAAELEGKLRRAGIKSHSIPVLDVGGKLLVGYSAQSLDEALAQVP